MQTITKQTIFVSYFNVNLAIVSNVIGRE